MNSTLITVALVISGLVATFVLLIRRLVKSKIKKLFDARDKAFQRHKDENCKIVFAIIDGSGFNKEGIYYKDEFVKWQDKLRIIFDEAGKDREKKLSSLIRHNKFFEMKGVYSQKTPDDSYELVIENVFSDSFPSTHDMDYWAINKIITTMMVLLGVLPEQSKDYFFKQKIRFVNHKKVQAIIVCDIYKKKH